MHTVRALLLSLPLMVLALTPAAAASNTNVAYGADTTSAQRQQLAQTFGVSESAQADTVSTAEMVQALQGTGLSVSDSDKSIASAAVTCMTRGDGLTVETRNVTRLTPFVYAAALVTAGASDSSIIIAAPQDSPLTGETALVGALKEVPHCQGNRPLDPAHTSLAYKQIAWMVTLAGPGGDLNAAAAMLLRAEEPVFAGRAQDDAAVSDALDNAASSGGATIDPSLRPTLLQFLTGLRGIDLGPYAYGFSIQQASSDAVRVVAAPATLTPGQTLAGQVERIGNPLMVQADGRDWQILLMPGTVINRNGRVASPSDLRPGDRVSVTAAADGSAQRVAATSPAKGAGTNPWRWIAVLLVVLIALVSVAYLLTGSRHDDAFILVPNAVGAGARGRRAAERGLPARSNRSR